MPKTMDEYYERSCENEKKKDEIIEPDPVVDERFKYFPKTELTVKKYNNPPGSPIINLANLKEKRHIMSTPVLSPDYTKVAYSSVYYMPERKYTSSEVFYIPAYKGKPLKGRLRLANVKDRERIPLVETGIGDSYVDINRTLTILDWSKDSQKLAVIEKISYRNEMPWQTNLWVYDFKSKKANKLTEVREAIRYYWLNHEKFDINDYEWDIKPIGWDANQGDNLIVLGFAYTKDKVPKFLGAWSVNSEGKRSKLLSLTMADFDISINGYTLKIKL